MEDQRAIEFISHFQWCSLRVFEANIVFLPQTRQLLFRLQFHPLHMSIGQMDQRIGG